METLRRIVKTRSAPSPPCSYVARTSSESHGSAYTPSYTPYPYQNQSAHLLEAIVNDGKPYNILCASPTGSGKSFLIKYAASLCQRQSLKCVVGVPLVALAVQQYEELCDLLSPTTDALFDGAEAYGGYEDDDFYSAPIRRTCPTVGLWTGPLQINETEALIVVCTYEVIQIQLDTNPAFMDGCPVLILDEIHTLGDPQRGHVLETILTHSQCHCQIVGLSGTLSNVDQVAEALGRTNESKTFVVGLEKRPIPLRGHVDIGNALRQVSFDTQWDDEAWRKAKEDLHMALPDRLSFAQLKTRLTNLLYRLRTLDMLPAMVVAFSCKKLNKMADAVHSIDFLAGDKRKKWQINVLFLRLRKVVDDDQAWTFFFAPLARLAQNGICVHHSQLPVPYLKLVTTLATHRLCNVVFCTSTLSTGLNLPMKTVVLTTSRKPNGRRFEPIPPNLFWQLLGRAGRPGLEPEGHVVFCEWEQRNRWDTLFSRRPQPLLGQGMVNVHTILQSYALGSIDAKQKLTTSPFSSPFVEHLRPLFDAAKAELESTYKAIHIKQVELTHALQASRPASMHAVRSKMDHIVPGDAVLVEPVFPRLKPHMWTFVAWSGRDKKQFLVDEVHDVLRTEWILDASIETTLTLPFEDAVALRETRRLVHLVMEGPSDTTPSCIEDVETIHTFHDRHLADRFGKDFEHLVALLVRFQCMEANHTVTRKGRIAMQLLVDDPIALTECIFQGLLPTHDVIEFVGFLTCFLDTSEPKHPAIQDVVDGVGLSSVGGAQYCEPMKDWAKGKNLVCVVRKHTVPVGKFCSMVNRLQQLLQQMETVLWEENDQALCREASQLIYRGLPTR